MWRVAFAGVNSAGAWKRVRQLRHSIIRLMPLIGMIGIKKNKVMKRIPFLIANGSLVPHSPQCHGVSVSPTIQQKKRVPMISIFALPKSVVFAQEAMRVPRLTDRFYIGFPGGSVRKGYRLG
jgi:hypothetical protein